MSDRRWVLAVGLSAILVGLVVGAATWRPSRAYAAPPARGWEYRVVGLQERAAWYGEKGLELRLGTRQPGRPMDEILAEGAKVAAVLGEKLGALGQEGWELVLLNDEILVLKRPAASGPAEGGHDHDH